MRWARACNSDNTTTHECGEYWSERQEAHAMCDKIDAASFRYLSGSARLLVSTCTSRSYDVEYGARAGVYCSYSMALKIKDLTEYGIQDGSIFFACVMLLWPCVSSLKVGTTILSGDRTPVHRSESSYTYIKVYAILFIFTLDVLRAPTHALPP